MLPGLDGLETCRRVKANPATADIPVIVVSACSDTEDIVAGVDQGAADYMAKRLRMIVEGMDEGLTLLGRDGRKQPGGGLRAMDLSLSPMASGEQLHVALLHDITHHKQSETALQRVAMADPLTGVAERAFSSGMRDDRPCTCRTLYVTCG
ncbi:hypothetical protein JN27_12745 [Massilia sp. BSC265]|nr:hypothetical protein JN27_12745 [Massilia sp. BSC265]